MIRTAPLLALPGTMRELGADLRPIADALGVPERVFEDPDESIAYRTLCTLMAACAKATGCVHLGLLVGQQSGLQTLGALGYLVRNAPKVGTALDTLARHMNFHDRGAAPSVERQGEVAFLRYDIFRPDIDGSPAVSDAAMAIGRNILLTLCGPDWKPMEVHFRHAQPINVRPYRQFFQAPVVFNAERTALVFQAQWLSTPVAGADEQLYRHFLEHVRNQTNRLQGGFEDRVYPTVQRLLMENRCSLKELARELSMHPRALERRFQENGTSFRTQQNQARHAMAQELLRDTESDLITIAAQLGYGSTSAFVRAFSVRERMPPAAWRKAERRAAPQPVRLAPPPSSAT